MPTRRQLIAYYEDQKNKLEEQVGRLASHLLEKRLAAEAAANNGAGIATDLLPSQTMESRLHENIPPWILPGNIGKVNETVWPFWFTTSFVEAGPESTVDANFNITQEAAFIAVSYTKTVFEKTTGPDNFEYLDPDRDVGGGKATNLLVDFRDAQSSREFHDQSIDIDHIGHPRFPTYFHPPMLILPNSTMEVNFTNNDTVKTYVPFITFFGYRVRVSDQQNILSTLEI